MTTLPTAVYAGRVESLNPAEIVQRITALRQEHRALDTQIEALLQARVQPEAELDIKRLKKRRLRLKDGIARLESLLIPDQPA